MKLSFYIIFVKKELRPVCLLTALLTLVFVLFLGVPALAADISMSFIKDLGLSRGADAIRPVAVTHQADLQEVCITDVVGRDLIILNCHGLEVFRTDAGAGIAMPASGCLTRDGGLVFIERSHHSSEAIRKLNLFGESVPFHAQPPADPWRPNHLVVARNGDLITLDAISGLMARHEGNTGDLLWAAHLLPTGEDSANMGRPVEHADGRLFVPGGSLHSVMVLDAQGNFLKSFGQLGSNPGCFSFPVGVALTPAGNLLVLDRMRHKILVFDADQKFLDEFGSIGAGPGRFYQPLAIASSEDGFVYVTQGLLGLVQVFRISESRDL